MYSEMKYMKRSMYLMQKTIKYISWVLHESPRNEWGYLTDAVSALFDSVEKYKYGSKMEHVGNESEYVHTQDIINYSFLIIITYIRPCRHNSQDSILRLRLCLFWGCRWGPVSWVFVDESVDWSHWSIDCQLSWIERPVFEVVDSEVSQVVLDCLFFTLLVSKMRQPRYLEVTSNQVSIILNVVFKYLFFSLSTFVAYNLNIFPVLVFDILFLVGVLDETVNVIFLVVEYFFMESTIRGKRRHLGSCWKIKLFKLKEMRVIIDFISSVSNFSVIMSRVSCWQVSLKMSLRLIRLFFVKDSSEFLPIYHPIFILIKESKD